MNYTGGRAWDRLSAASAETVCGGHSGAPGATHTSCPQQCKQKHSLHMGTIRQGVAAEGRSLPAEDWGEPDGNVIFRPGPEDTAI